MDWQIVLYHDEPQEAATDERVLSIVPRELERAIKIAQKWIDGYWQTASIHSGTYDPGVLGERQPSFEYDEEATPIRVGNGWVERD